MKKQSKDFSQQLQQRVPNALKQEQERVIVKPVDMLTPQDESLQEDKTTNLQEDKTESAQEDKPTNPQRGEARSIQVDKPVKIQSGKDTNGQTAKDTRPQIVKYTTHLRPDTVKAIKRYAVEYEIKDYEVVQKAMDQFFK
jgi:hypothetical protein